MHSDDARRFESAFLLDTLQSLGISARPHGTLAGRKHFCSLRAPESDGVYFLAGRAALPAGISGSLLIADRPHDDQVSRGNAVLVVAHPQLVYYRLMQACFPAERRSGIHPTATVSPHAEISPQAWIGPYCVVENAVIGPGVVLDSHVVVHDRTRIERGVWVQAHSTLGATGVAWIWDAVTGDRVRQPQIGGVVIGADSFIGSDVGIVRGSVNENTQLGAGCLIAHGSKIGHGCRLGEQVHFANNVSIAGNVDLGARCFLGSGCVLRPWVSLAEDTIVGVGAVVVGSFSQPGLTLTGVPARPQDDTGKEHHAGVPAPIKKREDHVP